MSPVHSVFAVVVMSAFPPDSVLVQAEKEAVEAAARILPVIFFTIFPP